VGRHIRSGPPPPAGPRRTEAETISTLPGWGTFATAVAAVSLHWTGATWGAVTAVTGLGLGTTAVLWWSACRAEGVRRQLARRTRGATGLLAAGLDQASAGTPRPAA